MEYSRERQHRMKLLVSTVALSATLVVAAVAQRNYQRQPPLRSEPRIIAHTNNPGRAVFGTAPEKRAEDLRVSATANDQADAERARIEGPRDIPGDIVGVLERWRASLAKGDLQTHLNTYAPRLDRFYRLRNVSRDVVRHEKERLLRIYPEVHRFEVTQMNLESLKGDKAVVTFRKDWDMRGSRRFAGAEIQRIALKRSAGSWLISGEQESRVFWVRR